MVIAVEFDWRQHRERGNCICHWNTRTSWTELQHWMSPVLQLSRRRTVGVATAKRGRARREKAAARANIVKECGGLGKE